MGRLKTGASGRDAELRVPPGTIIYSAETGAFVAEVLRHGERVLLLRGGRGGLGNVHFKSSVNRAPRQFTYGTEGESGEFNLVLKTIADAGMVGFPNAGKSSLVSLLTPARPKIGAYPFTTLHVNIGTLDYPEKYEVLKLADIPGLVVGASENKGLGHKFLRHIERNSVLLFMISAEEDDIQKCYDTLLGELRMYNPELLDKKRVLAITKCDLIDKDLEEEMLPSLPKDLPHVFISSVSQEGLKELKDMLWEALKD